MADVSHPVHVRLKDCKVAFEVIAHLIRPIAGNLPALSSSLRHALKTVIGHQSGDAITAGRFPRHIAWSPTCAARQSLRRSGHVWFHQAENTRVVAPATVGRTQRPFVVTATRDAQTAIHQLDRILLATAMDRRVPHDDDFAKKAAASRKKSRSFFVLASSRLSAASS